MVKSGREEGFLYNILYLTAEIRSTKQLIFIKNKKLRKLWCKNN